MKVGIWPFWSQQDKMAGNMHMLSTCGNAKQLAYVSRVLGAAGHTCQVAVPYASVGESPFKCGQVLVSLPRNNPEQRVHWDTHALKAFFTDCDVALVNNEYMAIPLRVLFPKLYIIQMCPVPVDTGLFKHAFDAADLVVVRSKFAQREVQAYTSRPVHVWPMFYNEEMFDVPRPNTRDIDVLFLPRCSANNATHHIEFLQAMRNTQWRVVFTDITRYLRKQAAFLYDYCTADTYVETLLRSKVVVSLYETWNGEMGLYEACAAGCTPVVAMSSHNLALFGQEYKYYVPSQITHTNVRSVIDYALCHITVDKAYPPEPLGGSYQACDKIILEDVCRS